MSNIKNSPVLIPATDFQRSGRCPVDLRWLIFNQKESLQEAGAISVSVNADGLLMSQSSSTGLEKTERHSVLSAEKN